MSHTVISTLFFIFVQPKPMKKVIVTGVTGFIGRHSLATLITKGFEVHAITSRTLPIENNGCNWHKANLLDTIQIQELYLSNLD
jgi:nucleoside-diphosphate-sugar epimerase